MPLCTRHRVVRSGTAAIFVAILSCISPVLQSQEPTSSVSAVSGAAIGAPFELRSSQGQALTEGTFRGRWLIVFFGYTSCPDVCPTTLATLTEALELLGAQARDVSAMFVTLDPRRDTPELLSQYVGHFSPRITAATGTEAQIDAAAKVFRVRYEIDGDVASGRYTISHPAALMLFDPHGRFVTYIFGSATAREVSQNLERLMSRPR